MSLTWLFGDRSAKSRDAAPVALKNVHVASPCTANWTQMSGDNRVRRCPECKLNVYNLSAMSRREAEELISSREGRLCVRFYQRADGTVLTHDCPVGLRQLVRKVSRIAGTALSALMSVGFCAAQSTPNCPEQTTVQNDQKGTGVRVTVTDPAGAVISGAQVLAIETETGLRYSASTDGSGVGSLQRLKPGSYRLEIHIQGFKTYSRTLSIAKDKMEQITAKLALGQGTTIVTGAPLVPAKQSTSIHTFEGDLLKAGTAH